MDMEVEEWSEREYKEMAPTQSLQANTQHSGKISAGGHPLLHTISFSPKVIMIYN